MDATKRYGSTQGFTLMELIVVMTLLAILSMTVTPVFRGSLGGAKMDHAMRDMFAATQGAQAAAITSATEHRLYLAPEENAYWIERAVVTEDGEREFESIEGRAGEIAHLPSSLAMLEPKARRGRERGTFYVSFFPSGACDIAKLIVAFEDDSRREYAIETTGTHIVFEAPES